MRKGGGVQHREQVTHRDAQGAKRESESGVQLWGPQNRAPLLCLPHPSPSAGGLLSAGGEAEGASAAASTERKSRV